MAWVIGTISIKVSRRRVVEQMLYVQRVTRILVEPRNNMTRITREDPV